MYGKNAHGNDSLWENITTNIQVLREEFGENNNDVVFREFSLMPRNNKKSQKAVLIFVDHLIDKELINEYILSPLMNPFVLTENKSGLFAKDRWIVQELSDKVIPVSQTTVLNSRYQVIEAVLSGLAVLIVDKDDAALSFEVRGWVKRGVSEPMTGVSVRGPREGFVETLNDNRSLLRRKIHHPDLTFDLLKVGRYSCTDVAVVYIKGVAEESLIAEVKKRIQQIDIDSVLDSGYIEQLVDDAPYSPFPTIGNNEKPDTISAKLLEGRVAVLVDGTPIVLSMPYLFIEAFQSTEDYYSRPYYVSMVRFIRYLAFGITILLPGFYIAMTTYHQELIPLELMLTMVQAESKTPFSTTISILLMTVIYEILREAGVRLPKPTGQAVSIVGGIIVGDAAVSAGIISAPVLIVIGITTVSSFVISPFTDAAAILRIAFIFCAYFLGGFGIFWGLLLLFLHLSAIKSFGVNYFLPFAPFKLKYFHDVFVRLPLWTMTQRTEEVTGINKWKMSPGQKPGGHNHEEKQ